MSAWFVGIRVSRASATIESCEIAYTRNDFGMGIELANTVNRDDSMIANSNVHDDPQAEIDMHNSNAMIERNVVQDNGLRGIAINEIPMAMVNANRVSENRDAGICIQDHSIAELQNNQVLNTRPGPSGEADGIKAAYYAEVVLRRNTIDAQPGHDVVLQSKATIEPWP